MKVSHGKTSVNLIKEMQQGSMWRRKYRLHKNKEKAAAGKAVAKLNNRSRFQIWK
jgi:hypothetical protein